MEREDFGRCAAQDPADNSRVCYEKEGMPRRPSTRFRLCGRQHRRQGVEEGQEEGKQGGVRGSCGTGP